LKQTQAVTSRFIAARNAKSPPKQILDNGPRVCIITALLFGYLQFIAAIGPRFVIGKDFSRLGKLVVQDLSLLASQRKDYSLQPRLEHGYHLLPDASGVHVPGAGH
jgi:hypothetical protein